MSPPRTIPPLLLLALLAAPAGAGEPPPPAYDSRPFLSALSPGWRRQPARRLGLADLNELPLYQLEVDFNPLTARLRVEQTVNFLNRGRRPLRRLVFRTWANGRSGGAPPEDRPLVVDSASVAGRP